jgi:cytochrome P450
VAVGGEPDERLGRLRELMPEMMRRCASPFTLLPWFRRELGGITPYARLRRVLDEIDEVLFAGIADRREQPDPWPDAMGLLVAATDEDGKPLGDRVIRDELVTLLMAGYETTTSGLAWAFERLLRTPAALDRLLEELDGEDRGYLDAVVSETLRLRTVVPVVARKVREPVTVGGHRVEPGSVLMASAYLLHRDPEIYADPLEFRPERFLNGEPPPGAWIPFGGGTRRCLGAGFAEAEMRTVLRTVLRTVRLSAPDPAPEAVARRRFTFAPGGQARARVDGPASA